MESNDSKQSKFHLFRKYYKILLSKDFNESDDWLDWFIGFTEGDGNLYTSVTSNKCSYTLTQKETTILNEVASVFDFGKVKLFTSGNKSLKENDILGYGRWTCYDKKYIFLLYLIFNNHFYLKNRNVQLNNWYYILINTPIDRFEPLNIYNYDDIPPFNYKLNKATIHNAWLSGFTDAEGCFNITQNVYLRFILDQAEEELLLNNIGEVLLDSYTVIHKKTDQPGRKSKKKVYNLSSFIRVDNKNYLLIRDYFNKYPLKTNKLNNYIHWCEVKELRELNLSESDFIKSFNVSKLKMTKNNKN